MQFKKFLKDRNPSIKDELNERVRPSIDVLFNTLIQEGVHDKGIFKAVFLAGGPGSGKDYVLDNTLAGHGLTEINSDKALEYVMDREGLDKTMPASEEEARNLIRGQAKNTTDLRQRLAFQGRNGLIINGTGDDPEKIKKTKERLEEMGYETRMILVNTRDDVSQQRNIDRGKRGGRTVPENIRKEKWDSVQAARTELAKLFGQNYQEFENSEDLRTAPEDVVEAKTKEMLDIFKSVKQFVETLPKNEKANQWIAQELQRGDLLKVKKSDLGKMPHDYNQQQDTGPASEAKRMGLQYLGYGRYGKNHKVTHRVVAGKLVEVPTKPTPEGKRLPVPGSSMSKTPTGVLSTKSARLPTTTKNVLAPLKSKEVKKEELNASFSSLISESYQLSSTDAKDILTLGTQVTEFVPHQDIVFENATLTQDQVNKMNLLKDSHGKVRIFMLRRSATETANTKGGVVYKAPRGYVIQLKENYNGIIKESVEMDKEIGRINSTAIRETRSVDESCGCSHDTSSGTKTKKTLSQTKKELEETSTIIKEIDKGIEPGLSMASSGENMVRDTTRTKAIKKPLEELSGDETTASISSQKEDELKKAGISLSSFKSKRPI